MKKIMWLCDMGGTFTDHRGGYIRSDVMDKILAFKANEGDVVAMATDSNRDYAENMHCTIASHQPGAQLPFDMLFHSKSFSAVKSEPTYWENLLKMHGETHAFILLDDNPGIRALAQSFGIESVDMSATRTSADILQDTANVRQLVAQTLAA